MLSHVESRPVVGQRLLSKIPLPPKHHKFFRSFSARTCRGGTKSLLQPHQCKSWLVVSVPLILQPVDEAHHWYYILEMGFYLSLLLCVSVDVKRKVSASFTDPVTHIHLGLPAASCLLHFPSFDTWDLNFSSNGQDQNLRSLAAGCFFTHHNPNVVFLLLD